MGTAGKVEIKLFNSSQAPAPFVAHLEAVQKEVSAARRQVEEDERRVTQLEQSILAAAFRGEA